MRESSLPSADISKLCTLTTSSKHRTQTYLQAEGTGGREQLRNLVRQEGGGRLFRGVSPTLMGCIPAHAMYFTIFEAGKIQFGADGPNHNPGGAAATGALATIAHDAVMTPMDVVKQRMQLGLHSSVREGFSTIIRIEGWSALFRSFPTTLAMNIPFAAVSVASNESLRRVINPSGEFSFVSFVASGLISGGTAGFFTTPFDVVRTRLNTQNILAQRNGSGGGGGGAHVAPPIIGIRSSSATATTTGTVKASPTAATAKYLTHASRYYPRVNAGVLPSALLASANKLSGSLINVVAGHNNKHRHPSTSSYTIGIRAKYTRPVRCPLPIALWASPGTSTLARVVAPPMTPNYEKVAAASSTKTLRYSGPIAASKCIWKNEGYLGFFRGARQRVAVQAPGFAISWTAYETAKAVLLGKFQDE